MSIGSGIGHLGTLFHGAHQITPMPNKCLEASFHSVSSVQYGLVITPLGTS